MINTKFFLSVAACGLLALSSFGVASTTEGVQPAVEDDVYYAKVFYNGAKAHKIKEIKDAKDLTGAKDYEPDYEFGKIGGGAALGYYFSGIRVELEGLISGEMKPKDDSKEFKLGTKEYQNKGFSHMSGFLNAYYDIALSDMFIPYVGGGAGVSYAKFKTEKEDKKLHIALQGKAGVNLTVSESIVPYAGYKILWMMDKEYDITNGADAEGSKAKIGHLLHNLEVGVMIPVGA